MREFRGDDEDDSSSEDSVRHLCVVRQLLDPVHRRRAVRLVRHTPAARAPVRVHAGAPACQP